MFVAGTPSSQIQALELLFNSTRGDQWRWRNEVISGPKWSFSSPQAADPCNDKSRVWQGITCSSPPNTCEVQSCEIVSLALNNFNLVGTLPGGFFEQLTSLTDLKITFSRSLVGSIPSEVGSLSQLVSLYFVDNQLTGTIPSDIGYLSQLVTLSLQDNQLTGTVPSEIGSLSHLVILSLQNNQLTGTIPSEIYSLSQLVTVSLRNNGLTGTIPSEIRSWSQVVTLSLENNDLTGTIPPEIGSMSQLVTFSVLNNHCTGTVPSEIGSLSQVETLSLQNNDLTGTIPSEIGSLSKVVTLSLQENQWTGTIPSEIGSLSHLMTLFLHRNHFTGTIPFEIGYLSRLATLSLSNNQLTGTIPSEIGSLSQLVILSLQNNDLTGTILSEIGSLSRLATLSLSNNILTGTILSEIGSLFQLVSLSLQDNQLTGTIPSSFSGFLDLTLLHLHVNHLDGQINPPLASLPRLQQLFLHRNHFTGRISSLISSPPWNASSSELLNLDVSDNLFSGSIPSTLFLPHLKSISLSLNCFEHELPSSICDVKEAAVISMDALGSAKDCKNVVALPLTSVTLVRSLEGSIPECVWRLSNLKILNLAGNGLTGTISTVASMPSLLSMTLSHNHLSGEIPLWLQKMNLSLLDLSRNKLRGDANGFRHQNNNAWRNELVDKSLLSQYVNRRLVLTVNRLSGDLPSSFANYEDLDMLSGNLFGCANLPRNDQSSDSVSCGSQEYDQAMMLMGDILVSIICLVSAVSLLCGLFATFRYRDAVVSEWIKASHRYLDYLRYHTLSPASSLSQPQSTLMFGSVLSRLMRSVCVLALMSLCLSLPIYVLKFLDTDSRDPQYITHNHMYNWLWTTAFLSGSTPAAIMLVMYLVCLLYFTFAMNRLGSATSNEYSSPRPSTLSKTRSEERTNHSLRSMAWTIFILNVAIVGTVNGLYLWSTLLDLTSAIRIWIQFSFGLFSFLWSVALRLRLPYQMTESGSGVWLFTCLNVVNSVIIPCIVTALTSPSCYQRLIVPPDDISSSYSYLSCVTNLILSDGRSFCLLYIPRIMDVLTITPPFYYSYQCGSTLLTSYIPVYVYSISLQILFIVATFVFIMYTSTTRTKYPRWLLKSFPGVCWPSYWSITADDLLLDPEKHPNPIRLIYSYQIISSVINNLVLLLSFGLCSPALCFCITLSICVHLCHWLILIGRFVCFRIDALATSLSPSDHRAMAREDQLLLLLDRQLHGVNSSFLVCKWPIILTSCFFVSLLCWDMAGDQGGWFEALWVPVVGVMMVLAIWVSNSDLGWCQHLTFSFLSNKRHLERNTIPSVEMVRSSLHQPPLSFQDNSSLDRFAL